MSQNATDKFKASSKKILVIAPHADDELIGLGGSLLKWKLNGARIKIILVACSDIYMCHANDVVSKDVRVEEFTQSCEYLSTEKVSIFGFEDSRLDVVPISDIVKRLDEELALFEPDTVIFPEPSYHQDHQVVNRACTASLRPTKVSRPDQVLLYEIPTSGWIGSGMPFEPNFYVDISETIAKKIEVFEKIYISQFTSESRSKLASLGILNHSKYRGFEAGLEYAEAFKLIHYVER